jgi:hypothetical protein
MEKSQEVIYNIVRCYSSFPLVLDKDFKNGIDRMVPREPTHNAVRLTEILTANYSNLRESFVL